MAGIGNTASRVRLLFILITFTTFVAMWWLLFILMILFCFVLGTVRGEFLRKAFSSQPCKAVGIWA